MKHGGKISLSLLLSGSRATLAQSQEAPDDAHGAVNEANTPLTPKITVDFQDYFVPSLKGVPDKQANQFLFRGLIPAFVEPQYTVFNKGKGNPRWQIFGDLTLQFAVGR